MKKIMTLSLAVLATVLLNANIVHAAIPIRQQAPATAQQSTLPPATATEMTASVAQELQQQVTVTKSAKKAKASSAMPALLYVILAIFALGWLAMGINDNFGDYDWLISLLLYILFYIPGLIYTLIKYSKYY